MAKQDEFEVEEWDDDKIAQHKAQFPCSRTKRFAVVDDDDLIMGFFDDRAGAEGFAVTIGREALIEASFIAWAKAATQTFVSDYDEVRKVVRAAL